MFKQLILNRFLFEGNERHLKFKNIILYYCSIFLHCIPQRKKPLPLYPTTEKPSSVCPTMEENLFRCPTTEKTSSVISYNEGKYHTHTHTFKIFIQVFGFLIQVADNQLYLPLWDRMEENLRRYGKQRRRFFYVGSHNSSVLYSGIQFTA